MPLRVIHSLDELKQLTGQEIGVSDWQIITQERIHQFAEATGDHQWIHIDAERAKTESPYGTTIAHGFLSLSAISALLAAAVRLEIGGKMGINYGLNRVRFPSAVPAGARVRGRFKILTVEDFEALAALEGLKVERRYFLAGHRKVELMPNLTAEVAVKLKQLGLPQPAALGIFSGLADFSRTADSQQLFALNGFSGNIAPQDPNAAHDGSYVGKTDPRDPVLSPLFADLHGFPPTLLITSTRDLLLSNTSIFHRALLRSGVDAKLVVFEALPHAFWYHFQLPETQEALELMAKFFDDNVGR